MGGFVMARKYQRIKQIEKEILELKKQGLAYFNLTQSYGITQSMSRRGNPYDNALAENFFSILKTECIHRVRLQSFEQARKVIDDYIYLYNNQRIQLKTKLTPMEYRCQYVA